jgi:hypothetical protein
MAVAHAGVEIPLVSGLGPGGSRAVWPAAVAFGVATVAYLAVAVGLRRRSRWSRLAGLGLFGVTVLASLVPFRGAGSVIGALLGAAGCALLARRSPRGPGDLQGSADPRTAAR